jgi:predicted AAA+ superfamily ATPase
MSIAPDGYQRRIVDDALDELVSGLPAVALEGAKGVGKTSTALRRARTVYRLDDASERSVVEADPTRLLEGAPPILVDEWQYVPDSWNLVRRAVDEGAAPGSFLLTGSTSPNAPPTHSGAARIVSVRVRPLALSERGIERPSVSLGDLLSGDRSPVRGATDVRLEGYVEEILSSGLPGLRGYSGRPLRAQLDSYVERVIDRDFDEAGHPVRKPATLRRWLAAYAAASSTTATFETVADAATGSRGERLPRSTTIAYRDVLERLWVLDPVPAWSPTRSRLRRLSSPPKHQLADPALAARLLGVDAAALLAAAPVGPPVPRDGPLLGALFESLVTLGVRVYAQASEARVGHLRTVAGEHEVDLIVERADGRIVAIEVKLARTIGDGDVRDLRWLAERLGDELLDAVVVTTGPDAYRRQDGIAVVPAALLGP